MDTARAMGDVLHLSIEVVEGIHEHDRRGTPFLEPLDFVDSMRRFFSTPLDCVFGRESAAQAASRFSNAIESLTTGADAEDLIVVTHGTVMTLFLERTNAIEPFSFWRSLPMPCAAILRPADMSLQSIVSPD